MENRQQRPKVVPATIPATTSPLFGILPVYLWISCGQ